MREDAFRAWLVRRISEASAGSYLAYLRRVERVLALDLDTTLLAEDPIDALALRLSSAGVPRASVRNCRAALTAYASFIDHDAAAVGQPAEHSALAGHGEAVLLSLYAGVLEELRARGTIRSANSPVGDYAETLFARAFGWTLEPNSRAAFDACDASGHRYQIKARRLGPKHKNCPRDLTNPPLPVYMPPWRSDWKIRASATLL